jgi:hypothetical protein
MSLVYGYFMMLDGPVEVDLRSGDIAPTAGARPDGLDERREFYATSNRGIGEQFDAGHVPLEHTPHDLAGFIEPEDADDSPKIWHPTPGNVVSPPRHPHPPLPSNEDHLFLRLQGHGIVAPIPAPRPPGEFLVQAKLTKGTDHAAGHEAQVTASPRRRIGKGNVPGVESLAQGPEVRQVAQSLELGGDFRPTMT